jgi:chromate transporter
MSETASAPDQGVPKSSPPPIAPSIPSHADLFFAFFWITVSGFGGTLPWTRRMFVEKKRWMTADQFNEAYALCQFLPGPNIVNLTAVFGSRMRGATGALAAWSGFLVLPFLMMVTIGALYAQYGDVDALRRVLTGVAAAAAGLLIATVAKMAVPLCRGSGLRAPVVLLVTAIAVGAMRWPLLPVLLILAPLSVALAWWGRR